MAESGTPLPSNDELLTLVARDQVKFGKPVWLSEHVIRPFFAIHLTRLFLRRGWKGDEVTLLMLVAALAGPLGFLLGGKVGYAGGALAMLLSYVLDHSDGQVRRYRGEDSTLGIYLDRFTHRVTYPLQHIALGVSLARDTGRPEFLPFGLLVAYFYQLVVTHRLDKQRLSHRYDGIDLDPLRTLRLSWSERRPVLDLPLKVVIGLYSQAIQNVSFVVLLLPAALTGQVPELYVAYGGLVMFNWLLRVVLDLLLAFRSVPATSMAWPIAGSLAGVCLLFTGHTAAYLAGALLLISSSMALRRKYASGNEHDPLATYLVHLTTSAVFPLQYLAVGYALTATHGPSFFLLFGGVVAYFDQLRRIHAIDKDLIRMTRDSVARDPAGTLLVRFCTRVGWQSEQFEVLRVATSLLFDNLAFAVLLIPAVVSGHITEFFLVYGGLVTAGWIADSLLDFTVVFPWTTRYLPPQGSLRPPQRHAASRA